MYLYEVKYKNVDKEISTLHSLKAIAVKGLPFVRWATLNTSTPPHESTPSSSC